MPKIPQVKSMVGVSSAPTVRQNIQVSGNTFGAATGRALQNLGEVGQNIAAEFQQRRNVIDVQNAYLAAMKKVHEYLHNPTDGVYSRQGVNAMGAYEEAMGKLPEIMAEATQNLSGAQRELFERQWQPTALSSLRGVMDFEGSAIRKEQSSALQSIQMVHAEAMSLGYQRPEDVQMNLTKLDEAVNSQAGLEGWNPAYAEVKKREIKTKALAGVFERFFAVDDVKGAANFLNQYGDQMYDGVASKLRDNLREKEKAVYAREQADIIVMQSKDEGEALDRIKEQYDGETRTRITQMVKADFSDKARVENERQNKKYYAMYEGVYNSPSRSAGLALINKETDPELRVKLLRVLDHKHPLQREGSGKMSDEQKKIQKMLEYVASNGIADQLKAVIDDDIEFYKDEKNILRLMIDNKLADPTILKELHSYARKEGVYAKVNNKAIYDQLSVMNLDTFTSLGIPKPDGRGKSDKITEADIPPSLVTQIAAVAKSRPQGELSPDEMKTTLKQLLQKGATSPDGWFFKGTEMPVYQAMMEGKQRSIDLYARMGGKDIAEISKLLQAEGVKQSKDAVNALARDWALNEEQEFPGSMELRKAYLWAKKQTVVGYQTAEGEGFIDMRNDTALQDAANWRIILQAHKQIRRRK